jgi:UDP-2,3-diacylglucosamine hydrolase
MKEGTIAVIAGRGMLPIYWLQNAVDRNYKTIVISICDNDSEEQLKKTAQVFFKIPAGRLGEIFELLKNKEIKRAVFLGNVQKEDLLAGIGPDSKLKGIIKRLNGWNAAEFFKALADEFDNEKIELLEQQLFMEDHLAVYGNMTHDIEVSNITRANADKGFYAAKVISNMGIGQTVVIKDGVIAAVEAIEGTNATILRSGSLVTNGIIVKVSADNQDFRFDIPVVGVDTIKAMISAKSSALVVEAGRTLMLDRVDLLKLATQNGIIVLGRKQDG